VVVSPAPPVVPEPPAPAPEPPPAPADKVLEPEEVYEQCVRSCVFIVTPIKAGHIEGAGALIDADKRLLITTAHVVEESNTVYVQFPVRNKDGSWMTDKKKYMERIPAGQALKGKVLHRDTTRDLALVQLDRLPPDTPALPVARQSVQVGATVVGIGHQANLNATFSTTVGTVRAVGIMAPGATDRAGLRLVTISNPINSSDSGGPLIDRRGHLMGVVPAPAESLQRVHGAIDVTEVRAFLAGKKVTIKEFDRLVPLPWPPPGPDLRPPMPRNPQRGPPDVQPPPAPEGDPPRDTGPSAEDERAAAQLLSRAKLFAEGDDNRPTYIIKLKDVVAKYPKTAAAKEAQKALDVLKK
jgi:hypothetical protein